MLRAKCWRQSQDIKINVCLHKYPKHLTVYIKDRTERGREDGRGRKEVKSEDFGRTEVVCSTQIPLTSHALIAISQRTNHPEAGTKLGNMDN